MSEFQTFEKIALEKLETLQPCSVKVWAKALGYETSQAFYWTQKKLLEKGKITRKRKGRKYLYKIKTKEV